MPPNRLTPSLMSLLLASLCVGCGPSASEIDAGAHPPQPSLHRAATVTIEGDAAAVTVSSEHLGFRFDLRTGLYDLSYGGDGPTLTGAQAIVTNRLLQPTETWEATQSDTFTWEAAPFSDVLGVGQQLTVTAEGSTGAPTLRQVFRFYDDRAATLTWVEVVNNTGRPISVGSISPVIAQGPLGALTLGAPRDLRVLTNGYLNYLDYTAPIFPGDVPTLSSWSSLLYNQETGRSLMVGAMTFDDAQPVVGNAPRADDDNQALNVLCEYEPALRIAAGDTLTSEVIALDGGHTSPHDALEGWADDVAAWQGIQLWTDTHPEIGTPVGWNSWSGSGSSGGYGTDINEEIIVANMDFADAQLRRWGMNYFPIDDGWQTYTGDWDVNASRFPDHGDQNGIAWLMDRAAARGFHPGLWIQAFSAEEGANILGEHPEYFADFMVDALQEGGEPQLDLTHPGAQGYLVELAERLKSWGTEWVKLDFAYQAVFTKNWYNDNRTRGQFYREGVETFEAALGDDIFFLNVAIVGWNIGLADSLRLTLDTMPTWDGEEPRPQAPLSAFSDQGLKPGYRDAVRRYYQGGKLWVNHPDLLFFRAHRDTNEPALTLNESRTFATAVALQGGLVKLGDRLVDLSGDAVDSIRRIIPPANIHARPVDLLEREFPEVWVGSASSFDEPYHVVGLLNWGTNRDLTRLPYGLVRDDSRRYALDLTNLGLDDDTRYLAYEFWSETFLGTVEGTLRATVPPHSPAAISLRPDLGRPQIVGSNRHVLGGVGVIEGIEWDDERATLTVIQEGAVGTEHAPFTHRVAIHTGRSWAPTGAEVDIQGDYTVDDVTLTPEGEIVWLGFTVNPVPGGSYEALGSTHPTVTWTVSFR